MKKLNMMIALLVIASVVLAACTPPATEAPTQAPAPAEAPTEAPTAAPTEPPVVEPTAADCPKAAPSCLGPATAVRQINDKPSNHSARAAVLLRCDCDRWFRAR